MDRENRVLLFRFIPGPRDPDQREIWITPGGGIDAGEQPHEAAARELLEETGLVVDAQALLPMVAFSEGFADLRGWLKGIFRDNYFFHRVEYHEVDPTGQERWESEQIRGAHWWSADELRGSDARIIPLRLADLLDDLVAGRFPGQPWELEWHH